MTDAKPAAPSWLAVKLGILAVFCALLVYGIHAAANYRERYFLAADPYWMMFATRSIVQDFDLDLRNQLEFNPDHAEDQTARGKRGEWYPIHEYLMAIVASPFYVLFGETGLLIFNVLISAAAVLLMYLLSLRVADPLTAFAATTLCAFTTPLLEYSFSFSIDVFGMTLLLLALYAAHTRPAFTTGLLFGLSVMARLTSLVTLPAFLYLLLTSELPGNGESKLRQQARLLLNFGIGAAGPALVLLASNWYMFGSPFDLAYDHWVRAANGTFTEISQRGLFVRPLLDGMRFMLFDHRCGFLPHAPIVIPALLLGFLPCLRSHRRDALATVLIFMLLLLLYSAYSASFPGIGNRYLLVGSALAAPLLAAAMRTVVHYDHDPKSAPAA